MRSLCYWDSRQQREVVVLEAGPDGTPDQAVGTKSLGRLPPARRNDMERCGCGGERPEGVSQDGTAKGRGREKIEWRTLVVVPGLVGRDAMPATKRAFDEEKVDDAER
jgi:hypothetical protein